MTGPPTDRGWRRRLRGALREPLLHFAILGLATFAAYAAVAPPDEDPAPRIHLGEGDLTQMLIGWQSRWQRPPTPEELQSLVDARVQEEVLYREAIALGLDEGDVIVRRRLAQKMEFLLEEPETAAEPAPGELRAWFERHPERFERPGRVTFRQFYFSPDRHAGRTREAASEALRQLEDDRDAPPAAVAGHDPLLFQPRYEHVTREQVAAQFGDDFARQLFGLAPGAWRGPVASGLGWHVVFVEGIEAGAVAPFDEVEEEVRRDWRDERAADARRRRMDELRSRYVVELPEGFGLRESEPAQAPSSPR